MNPPGLGFICCLVLGIVYALLLLCYYLLRGL